MKRMKTMSIIGIIIYSLYYLLLEIFHWIPMGGIYEAFVIGYALIFSIVGIIQTNKDKVTLGVIRRMSIIGVVWFTLCFLSFVLDVFFGAVGAILYAIPFSIVCIVQSRKSKKIPKAPDSHIQELRRNTFDVVYLKNGSIIRGEMTEIVANEHVKIKSVEGSVFVFKMDEIVKIEKETIENDVEQQSSDSQTITDIFMINEDYPLAFKIGWGLNIIGFIFAISLFPEEAGLMGVFGCFVGGIIALINKYWWLLLISIADVIILMSSFSDFL